MDCQSNIDSLVDLYANNTRLGLRPIVKASLLGRFIKSDITVWCDIHVNKRHRDPINLYQELLFKRGHDHHAKVAETLFGDSITETFKTEEEGFTRNLRLMINGADATTNMPLLCRPLGLEGRPDILKRIDGHTSKFGSYAYEIIEIKSARKLRQHHILQAALYYRVLSKIQGVETGTFHLINGDMEMSSYFAADYEADLDLAVEDLRQVLAGAPVPAIYRSADWPWQGYVDHLAVDSGDISILPGVRKATRESLLSLGLDAVSTVADSNEEFLTKAKGIGVKTASKIITAAQAIRDGQTVARGEIDRIPTGSTEIFIDLEGSMLEIYKGSASTVNYLIGALIRSFNDRESEFVAFFADRPEEEADNTRAFFRWAYEIKDPIFYHWHNYERAHLKNMSRDFQIPENHADFVLDRLVDLSPLTTKAFAFPTYREGLKDIAQHLGFQWRQEDVNALDSVALYSHFIESGSSDESYKQKILIYNEDDCRATMAIYDWLKRAG